VTYITLTKGSIVEIDAGIVPVKKLFDKSNINNPDGTGVEPEVNRLVADKSPFKPQFRIRRNLSCGCMGGKGPVIWGLEPRSIK
jgi:hypothetical protein